MSFKKKTPSVTALKYTYLMLALPGNGNVLPWNCTVIRWIYLLYQNVPKRGGKCMLKTGRCFNIIWMTVN